MDTVEQVEEADATDEGGPLSELNWLRLLELEDEAASEVGDTACLCASAESGARCSLSACLGPLGWSWAPIEPKGSTPQSRARAAE